MGGLKKLFGGGAPKPIIEKVDPAPTTVATTEVSGETGTEQKKKRRGFASTQTSTIAGEAGGRSTLG